MGKVGRGGRKENGQKKSEREAEKTMRKRKLGLRCKVVLMRVSREGN